MPEGVDRKMPKSGKRTRLAVALFKSGRFDVSALGGCGEDPFRSCDGSPHLKNRIDPLRQRKRPARVPRLAEGDQQRSVPAVLPSKPVTLLWPEATIEQDGRYVPQEIGVFRFDGALSPRGRSNTCKRSFVVFQDTLTDRLSLIQVRRLFVRIQDAFALP